MEMSKHGNNRGLWIADCGLQHPTSHFRHPTFLLALASVAALGLSSAASAAIISFENPPGPGHFDWNASAGHEFLNITLDAASQPGLASTAATFWRQDVTSGATLGTRIRGAISTSRLEAVTRDYSSTGTASFLAGLDSGTPIPTPTGPDMTGFAVTAWILISNFEPGFTDTELPENTPTYLGVNLNLGAGTQYGWIGITRTGMEVDAFAWAYETEVGVPIAAGVPEPASLSLLLFGGVALLRHRRNCA